MAKISFVRSVNGKILIASVLACFALFMAWETNRSAFKAVLTSFENVTAPNDKLRLINEITHSITRLDDVQKDLLQKTPAKSFGFFDQTKQLGLKIDTLKNLSAGAPSQVERLDELKKLLQDRDKLYIDYLDVRWGLINNNVFSTQVRQLNTIVSESARKTDSLVSTTEKKSAPAMLLKPLTEPEKPKHQGFLGRLFGGKKAEEEQAKLFKQHQLADSELKVKQDTIALVMRQSMIKGVHKTIRKLEKTQQSKSDLFVKREAMLNKASANIIGQSLAILKKVENEALLQSLANRDAAKTVVHDSIRRISIIMLLFFISIAGLLYFILRDITRIDNYRKQLELAKEEAEYHALAKHRFLSNMSHEIRTPLQSIIGYSELVRNQKNPKKDDVDAIFKSSNHLLHIVNEVLDYNRIISGKFTFSNETFNLKAQLEEVISVLRLQAEKKEIALNADYDASTDSFLTGDPFRLKQILYNLLGNAIKFTRTGEVVLTVTGEQSGDEIKYNFNIKDTGVGISAADLSRIFIEFEQARDETHQSKKGTGLGLAISKQLIETLGGKINVESEPGQGSTFTFDIQFKKVENPAQISSKKKVAIPQQTNHKVWLIDDDNFILDYTARLLEQNKIRYRCFSSPTEVLNTPWDNEVKFIFIDIRMPEMSGTELCRRLRERVPLETQIFALTAQVMPEEHESVLKQGFSGLLMKPFKEYELIALIKNTGDDLPINDQPILNIKAIEKMTFGDAGQTASILLRFSQDSLNDIDEIYARVNENNIEMVMLLLHRVAGRTAQAGGRELSESFRLAEMELEKDRVLTDEKIKNILWLSSKLNTLAIAARNYNKDVVV
jgi:signal transduction histidine kinase/CheY-like chemotaxis protein